MDFFSKTIQENSLLWIVLSAGVGGIIGYSLKFLFEQVVTNQYQNSLSIKAALKKYKYPLLRSADILDKRLQNLIQFFEKEWYIDENDSYYHLSTLYIFANYFGWCKIIEDEAYLEYEKSNKKARMFNIMLNTAYKGFTSFNYFHSVSTDIRSDEIEKSSIPRLVITAIGELMIAGNDNNKKVISFTEFVKKYEESIELKKWVGYLDHFLREAVPNPNNAKWNRLLIFAINIRAFVLYLDNPRRQTGPKTFDYLRALHPNICKEVKIELKKMGHIPISQIEII